MSNRRTLRNITGLNAPAILSKEDIVGKKPYSGIPTPNKDVDSLYNTVIVLQEIVETLVRQRGDVKNSGLSVGEAERIVAGLRFDIQRLEDTKQDKP